MKKILLSFLLSSVVLTPVFSYEINFRELPKNDDSLEGDVKLACEAILCLSTGTRPSECMPSIKKFFSIWDKKPWKIPQKRFNFLAMCPVATPNIGGGGGGGASRSDMVQYMNIIANGATVCSANYLNQKHWRMVKVKRRGGSKKAGYYTYYIERKQIIPTLPDICENYVNHKFTDGTLLQSLTYKVNQIDDGKEFGSWVDNQIEFDFAGKSDQDNSEK